ncbi:MAG: L,D-transpeptidase family protein [Clostridia bacterium]|nr:L,D-transpeptidase family protein [Clostridia bacterium]
MIDTRWFIGLLALLGLVYLLPAQSEPAAPYIIHIDVEAKCLTLFQGDMLVKQYTVATGAWDTPSPIGVFEISHRFSGNMCGFGTCFLGLNVPWGNFGIHGTDKPESIGYNASHGCIRMTVADAEELYALVPNGTTVVIECGSYGELGTSLRTLKNGDRSSMVCAVQRKLRALGFYYGWPDGIFGDGTQQAVNKARKAYGLPDNGLIDWALYQAIGLTLFE